MSICNKNELRLLRHKARVTYLGNFCPTVTRVSHLFEPQFFLWRPWGISTAFFGRRRLNRRRLGIFCWSLWLQCRGSSLRSGRSGSRRLNLASSSSNRSSRCYSSRRWGSIWSRSLSLATLLCWRGSRGLLLGSRGIWRLRDIHRRLDRSRVMLLLLLLGSYSRLGSSVREFHALLGSACHIGLVGVIAVCTYWSAILLLGKALPSRWHINNIFHPCYPNRTRGGIRRMRVEKGPPKGRHGRSVTTFAIALMSCLTTTASVAASRARPEAKASRPPDAATKQGRTSLQGQGQWDG